MFLHSQPHVSTQAEITLAYNVANISLQREHNKLFISLLKGKKCLTIFFFKETSLKLLLSLASTLNINQPERLNPCSPILSDLLSATEEEITEMLRSSKTCDLDPTPAQLLKQYKTAISPVLTEVVNKSL